MTIVKDFFFLSNKIFESFYERSGLLKHPSLLGSEREFFIANFLETAFPKKFVIGKGIIVDSIDEHEPSKEADIVIYNESSPIFNYGGSSNHFLSDGVLAQIEVKSYLKKNKLRGALNVTKSIKKLNRSITPGTMWYEDENNLYTGDHFINTIPSYIFAYDGPLFKTIKKNINEYYEDDNNFNNKFDGLCVLNKYTILKRYTNNSKRERSFFYIERDDSLMVFFMSLYWNIVKFYYNPANLLKYEGEIEFRPF